MRTARIVAEIDVLSGKYCSGQMGPPGQKDDNRRCRFLKIEQVPEDWYNQTYLGINSSTSASCALFDEMIMADERFGYPAMFRALRCPQCVEAAGAGKVSIRLQEPDGESGLIDVEPSNPGRYANGQDFGSGARALDEALILEEVVSNPERYDPSIVAFAREAINLRAKGMGII